MVLELRVTTESKNCNAIVVQLCCVVFLGGLYNDMLFGWLEVVAK